MLLIVIGSIVGIISGIICHNFFNFNPAYSVYIYLLILAIINSLLTILTKKNTEDFQIKYCFMYVFIDIILSVVLAFMGEQLGLPLYLVAIFAFGNNIYKNLYLHINAFVKKKKV